MFARIQNMNTRAISRNRVAIVLTPVLLARAKSARARAEVGAPQ
jgi:hypothetical protein